MNRFSIKDIENLTGIKAHTLRIWEQRHKILIPKRTDTNIRYYDGDDLKQALRVSLLNKNGVKISQIQKMTHGEVDKKITEIVDTELHYQHLLNTLLECTVDMDIDKFEQLINKYIKRYGLEQAIEQIIFSFLEKIGMMWMTSKVFPAQEHIISNIIRRKLLLAIERLRQQGTATSEKKFLLFLPEGEIHEIGLLYMYYQLLKAGNAVIYLGADAPLDQVEFVNDALNPDFLYTHLTSVSKSFDLNSYIYKLSAIHPEEVIYVSGTMTQTENIGQVPENVVIISSLAEAKGIYLN